MIGAYKQAYAAALTFLPVSQLVVLQFTLDAYLLPLFYVPPQAELYGNIAFILATAANSVLGGSITATTLLGQYEAFLGEQSTPSKGTIAPLPTSFYWGVSSSGYQSEGNQGQVIDSNCKLASRSTVGVVLTGLLCGTVQRHVDRNETDQPYYNSVNFFERYPEDIGNAKMMGLTVRCAVSLKKCQLIARTYSSLIGSAFRYDSIKIPKFNQPLIGILSSGIDWRLVH